MMQDWTKKITLRNEWLKISKNYTKGVISGYVYVEKLS